MKPIKYLAGTIKNKSKSKQIIKAEEHQRVKKKKKTWKAPREER